VAYFAGTVALVAADNTPVPHIVKIRTSRKPGARRVNRICDNVAQLLTIKFDVPSSLRSGERSSGNIEEAIHHLIVSLLPCRVDVTLRVWNRVFSGVSDVRPYAEAIPLKMGSFGSAGFGRMSAISRRMQRSFPLRRRWTRTGC